MELIRIEQTAVVVRVEVDEAGALAHLLAEPESADALGRNALEFMAAVRWLPVLLGRLTPDETARVVEDARELGWDGAVARSGLDVHRIAVAL